MQTTSISSPKQQVFLHEPYLLKDSPLILALVMDPADAPHQSHNSIWVISFLKTDRVGSLHQHNFCIIFITSVLILMILLVSILCIHFRINTKGGYLTPLHFHDQQTFVSLEYNTQRDHPQYISTMNLQYLDD